MAPATPQGGGYTNPVVLYGNVVASPNTDSVVPNALLSNPYSIPIELLEVRFRLLPQNTSSGSPGLSGLGLGVKMDLGKAAVVDAYVPVGNLGSVRDSYENQPPVYASVASSSVFSYPSVYGWRLKYPLYIPPGATLSCVVRPLGQNEYPVSVDVVYICRTFDPRRPKPATVKVPWVASYESKVFDWVENTAATSDESNNLDIINQFNSPLELSRLTGRVSFFANGADALGPDPTASDIVVEDSTTFRDTFGTIQIRSSRGFDIVRNAVGFGGLFPFNWRVWDLGDKWYMASREFYKVRLNVAAITDPVEAARVARAQFSVGVVGYRDVPAALLEG